MELFVVHEIYFKNSKEKKKKISEAGNRTPVARVTGGNTRPLYYFGTAYKFITFLYHYVI